LAEQGWGTMLLTDEPEVAGYPTAADFAEQAFVEPSDADCVAEDISETALARLFGTASDWLGRARQPFCLWLHARGLAGAWDAPLEFRNQYAEEDDPTPPDCATVPDRWLPDRFDPDEVLGVTHAYAGQVALVDLCVGGLLDALAEHDLDSSTLVALLSARGFPLGEHRRIGRCDEALYNETVQVPWLLRFPCGLGKMARSQVLVQPADLPLTVLDWLGVDRRPLGPRPAGSLLGILRGDEESVRDRIVMRSRHEHAIRTPAWHLRQPMVGAAELYAKPSDRWEVNEVANLMPEVASGLQAALAQSDASAAAPPLAEALVTEVD
jgi:arylsulfatase A-like enzyme